MNAGYTPRTDFQINDKLRLNKLTKRQLLDVMERVSPAILEELLRRMTDYELTDFKAKCQKNDIPLDKFKDKRLQSEGEDNALDSVVPDAHYIEQLSKPELVDLIQHRLTDEQLGKMLEKLTPKDTQKLL